MPRRQILVFPHRPVHVTVSVFYGATVNIIREIREKEDFTVKSLDAGI